jgi:hypothetical protein
MRMPKLLPFILLATLPAISQAQLFRPFRSYSVPHQTFSQVCPGPGCVVVQGQVCAPVYQSIVEPSIQQLSTPEGVEEVASAVADGPHTRAMVSGSCGSGTICGADAGGAFVLSNAHVWGTSIGKQVTIDVVADGQTKRLTGKTVFAGYSNSRMVDFCIAYFEGLSSKRYMQLLKTEPESPPYGTTGSPRCVWPLVTKQFNDPRDYGQGLLTGTPDAIGGQSGSAIYNADKRQIALLTWSINGRCAGQKTSKLWEVASQRDVSLADLRPADLEELYAGENRPETQEGVFGELPECFSEQNPELTEGIHGEMPGAVFEVADYDGADDGVSIVGQRKRPMTENIISSIASSNLEDMPIWYTPGGGGPVDPPVDPTDPDCRKLTAKEWELIQFIRAQQNEAAFGDALKNIDWVKLAKTIIEIIKLFQSMQ